MRLKINYKILLLFLIVMIIYIMLQIKFPQYSELLTIIGGITGFIIGYYLIETEY